MVTRSKPSPRGALKEGTREIAKALYWQSVHLGGARRPKTKAELDAMWGRASDIAKKMFERRASDLESLLMLADMVLIPWQLA